MINYNSNYFQSIKLDVEYAKIAHNKLMDNFDANSKRLWILLYTSEFFSNTMFRDFNAHNVVSNIYERRNYTCMVN